MTHNDERVSPGSFSRCLRREFWRGAAVGFGVGVVAHAAFEVALALLLAAQ